MSWPCVTNLCPATEAQNLHKACTGRNANTLGHCCFRSRKPQARPQRVQVLLDAGSMQPCWSTSWFPHILGVGHSWLGVAKSARETGLPGAFLLAAKRVAAGSMAASAAPAVNKAEQLGSTAHALESKRLRQACATDWLRMPGTWGTSSSATRRPPTMRAPSTTAGRAGTPRACSSRPARPRTSACH